MRLLDLDDSTLPLITRMPGARVAVDGNTTCEGFLGLCGFNCSLMPSQSFTRAVHPFCAQIGNEFVVLQKWLTLEMHF